MNELSQNQAPDPSTDELIDLDALFATPQLITDDDGRTYDHTDGLMYRPVTTENGGLTFVPVSPAVFYDPVTGRTSSGAEVLAGLHAARGALHEIALLVVTCTVDETDAEAALKRIRSTVTAVLKAGPDLTPGVVASPAEEIAGTTIAVWNDPDDCTVVMDDAGPTAFLTARQALDLAAALIKQASEL